MSAFTLESYITIDEELIKSPNIADKFSERDLLTLGEYCAAAYERDLQSREKWRQRMSGALELAMQVQTAKTFPWPDCSNIIFPLVTIAALQFHARAYPTIISGKDVVKCRVIGQDPQGLAKARAEKVSQHMSWQLLEEDQAWEEETDRALINLAIVGCGFKKSYYNADLGHNVSEYVQAKDLVCDYWAKHIDTVKTKTHVIPLYRNEIYTRVKSGAYLDILDEPWFIADAAVPFNQQREEQDQRAGINRSQSDHDTPFTMCEQHCWLDLDNDGYEEPYVVTFEEASHNIVRIVARFDRIEDVKRNSKNEIVKINAWESFTKLSFIPAPDGSFMDIGFGILMGPLNESVNAAINQLFDAGTLANTAGGFLGRGAKIRGGVYEFAPFSWNRVDSTGDDLRKSIYPLPVREPSAVMFNLLSLIIDYSNRISGSTDINVGENVGQNTPAETARTMTEQGQKIYTAIFKRIWRGLKFEFQKLYQLNAVHLPAKTYFGADGQSIGREDYLGPVAAVVPIADPTIASESARYARAVAVKAAAQGNGAYDADAVEKEFLKSIGVVDVDVLYKGVANAPPPPPDVKLLIQQMKTQEGMARLELEKQQFVATMQETIKLNQAKIIEMAAKAFKLQQEGEIVKSSEQIEAFRAAMELMREQNAGLDRQINALMEIGKNELEARGSGQGLVSFMEGASGNGTDVPALAGPSAGTGGGLA